MKNITFAERLKEARKAANLSQQALADKIGRTKSTISRWESGERNPKMFEMVELENILGIQARDLMFGEQEITDTILPKISQVSSELTKPRQEKVLNFATNQLDEQNQEKKKESKIVSIKNEQEKFDLADLVDDSKVDWDKWVSFDGRPLTDEVKEAMKKALGKELEDK
ncbi:helix-turn-helix domain-containing protein [Lactococcus lactis]|uniref:helix-turn-helix domain-containing protein n=1 Tax=Lactococcus lactis TaxID=1358 RepID=UPI0025A1D87B|nr:helix-turn-helix domain-containing protein [Lactococcus lactis]MDM7518448.1 helix-turn-helix domain-containing protein [Lactococcus lactis]